MINLLPPERKALVLADYRRRRLVTGGLLFSGLLALTLLVLLVLLFSVRSRRLAAEATLGAERARVGQTAILEEELVLGQLARELGFLTAAASRRRLTEVVETILAKPRSGIRISDLTFDRAAGQPIFRLAGVAATRQSLLDFLAVLRQEPLVKQVESPVSNLIRDREAEFTINLQING